MKKKLILDGFSLTPRELSIFSRLALDPTVSWEIELSSEARERIVKSSQFISKIVAKGDAVYGVNTGFGKFAQIRIDDQKLKLLQKNIILSHACGVGELLDRNIVFSMWILRLNVIARGHSGIRLEIVDEIIKVLNLGIFSEIPSRGSVGASGDLCPSAHATLFFLGEGTCSYVHNGEIKRKEKVPAVQKLFQLTSVELGPKEGLSLINGTQLTTALAVQAWVETKKTLYHANLSFLMLLEAIRASHSVLNPLLHQNKNQVGAQKIAEFAAQILQGTTEISESHVGCSKVQDAYSIRCAPLVHGMVYDELAYAETILEREINSSTDNPLIFPEEELSISGGNFHAMYPARMSDHLVTAMTTLANISERRIASAMNPEQSGLSTFLVPDGGLNSGFMMLQVTAAALVSEAKSLCYPASVDSIPTNNDQEDHVSMGPQAGFKAIEVLKKLKSTIAIELMVAAQGIDFLRPLKSSIALEKVHSRLREDVPFLENDRFLAPDVEKIEELMEKGAFAEVLKK